MGQFARFKDIDIDWNMTPEDAVALYLEWGNSGYGGSYENRVKSKADVSYYFVINTWENKPKGYLIRRNSDGAEELTSFDLPGQLEETFLDQVSHHKGVYGVTPEVREWLESEIFGT
ncbi:DVU0772 family protein [Desulfoplanes sp. PS50]|jgi:hypothetical protein